MREAAEPEPAELTVEPQRFAVVPEWVIDSSASDAAFRLYVVLLRYGASSGSRMPARSTLARRLRRSVDSVDRAMRELERLGVVVVQRRRVEGRNLTNLYHVRTTEPAAAQQDKPATVPGSRRSAATPSRKDAATRGRSSSATPAAHLRPDPESPTESTPTDLEALARACRQVRADGGLSTTRWSVAALRRALKRVRERGLPVERFEQAVLLVARQPETISPARVAEVGPWWEPPIRSNEDAAEDLIECERRLDALDGARLALQRRAREELGREGRVPDRASVLRRAVLLLEQGRKAAG